MRYFGIEEYLIQIQENHYDDGLINIFGLDGVWKHVEGFRIRTGS